MSKFPNQSIKTSIVKKAKSVEAAVNEALNELGINEKNAVIEIIQEPSKGIFGIGAKEAEVRVSVKNDSEPIAIENNIQTQPEKTAEPSLRIYNSAAPEENAKNFIKDVLSAMGIDVTVTAVLEDDVVNIDLAGENMGIVIGKRGDTLDSLQYLTSLVVNQSAEDYIKVSIDTENYREKRREALVALSNRLAAKVGRTGKKFALEPMNPYERRIIHANLQDSEEVTTFSVGQEPYRKVIIAPKNYTKQRSYGKGKNDRRRTQDTRRTYISADKQESDKGSVTYKADFKPQQHKAEYKNFEEYLAAHSED